MNSTRASRRARLALVAVIVALAVFGGAGRRASAPLDGVTRGVHLVASSSGVEHATAALPKAPAPFTSALTAALGGLVAATALLAAWPGVLAARGPTAVPATVDARWRRRGPPPR